MKRLYTLEKWQVHSEKVLRKRLTRTHALRKRRAAKTPPAYPVLRHENKVLIPAPDDFSILRNPNAMLTFFATMTHFARKGLQIHLDLSTIETLESDAVLYLL